MTTAPSTINARCTRDALLIHGLALFCAAATTAVALYGGRSSELLAAFVGIGLAMTLGLGAWSAVLAARALWVGERARWPVAVLVLFGLEAGAASLLALALSSWLFDITAVRAIVSAGLPVFVPVFVLASFIAAPVAVWRVRRADRGTGILPVSPGGTPKPRWKRGLVWYCAVFVFVTVLLLPCPLFLYCVWLRDSAWQVWVFKNTPVPVGDAGAWLVSWSSRPAAVRLYCDVLATRRVSRSTLVAGLRSSSPLVHTAALEALFLADPQAALDHALRVAYGGVQCGDQSIHYVVGTVIAKAGSPEQIRTLLDRARQSTPYFLLRGFFCGLADGKRADVVPDLARYCRAASPCRREALEALAQLAPLAEIERLWADFLADPDATRQWDGVHALRFIADDAVRLKAIVARLETPVPASYIRERMMQEVLSEECRALGPRFVARFVAAVLPILNDDKYGTRRTAALLLTELTDAAPKVREKVSSLFVGLPGPTPDEEQEIIEGVRAAARTWLEQQQPNVKP